MDDHRLSELLERIDRPENPTADEMQRIRARLGLPNEHATGPTVIDLRRADAARPPRRRRWMPLVAAAITVVAGTIIALNLRGTDDVVYVNDPVRDAIATVCDSELTDLLDALEQWRTVENWAFTQHPEPDLAALTDEMLQRLAGIEPLGATASAIAEQLAGDLQQAEDGRLPMLLAEATGREAALRAALDRLADALASDSVAAATCDIDRLRELLGP